MSSNQNIPHEGSEQNKVPANADNQLPNPSTELDALASDPIIQIPPSTNDQTKPPMEVHHHGHVHEKKKWKEYLFQFLMLFLAVFCGFLAEYQLEHVIEHEREEKYIAAMLTDLSEDTTRLNRAISNSINKFHSIASLITLLEKTPLENKDQTQLYELYFQSVGIPLFSSNDRTSRQLLNSGGMRLIKKPAVADSIIDYYGPNKEFTEAVISDITYFTREANLYSQDIFDFSAAQFKLDADSSLNYEFHPERMLLLTTSEQVLKKYANKNAACRGMTGNYLQHLIKLKKRAISLIGLLKQEYSI